MAFQGIIDLFSCIQSIKGKYPMVVSHLKHLQKCSGNTASEDKELSLFKAWLTENPNLPKIEQPFYKSKTTICFTNVYSLASEEVIKNFESKLLAIESLIFPDGRPVVAENTIENVTPGVSAALAEIEQNPVFSGLMENIKSTVADTDIMSDPEAILENKNFKSLLKNIQGGLKSGKFKLSDITSTIHSVIDSISGDLNPETKDVLTTAMGMMSAAEQGQQPDVSKILDMMKSIQMG